MAPWHIWLSAAALVTSIPLLWYSVAADRSTRRARDALMSAMAGTFRETSLARPARERILEGSVRRVVATIGKLTPVGMAREYDRRLARAGLAGRWTAERLLTVKALASLGVFLAFMALSAVNTSAVQLLLGALLAVFVFIIPDILIVRRGDAREAVMRQELPDIIDQVVIAVEAGLSFDSALDRVARKGSGPLAQEFHRFHQDISLGMSRRDGLMALADRTELPELRELMLALAQSEAHGLPLGRVLRVQADEIRDKRKSRAEERAMKVPVKIVVPVVLCIFPCLIAVIIGPALIRIFETLGT